MLSNAGSYRVGVSAANVSFDTSFVATDSGQFDIDVRTASLRGLVVDAVGREPIAGVEVSLWKLDEGDNTPARTISSNARGEFGVDVAGEGRYRVLMAKSGYAQQIRELELSDGFSPEVVFELAAAEGLALQVVDARDGRPLDANVVVRDLARRIVANRHSGVEGDGTLRVSLEAGPYLGEVVIQEGQTATLLVP